MIKTQVRKAVLIDADAISDIYNHHIEIGGSTFDTQQWTASEVAKFIEKPMPNAWFVAEFGHEILGWSATRPHSTRHGYRYTCETAIYLHSDSTGCGIGGLLQNQIEQHCRQAGLHHAVAKIISDNHRSISFHQRHGYEIVGIQKEIGHIQGKWCDVTIMQRIFD
jgi:phosphinothricin acetyltransferase